MFSLLRRCAEGMSNFHQHKVTDITTCKNISCTQFADEIMQLLRYRHVLSFLLALYVLFRQKGQHKS